MINIKNVFFSYPGNNHSPSKPILANINFNIKNGEFVSILGRSGCGKTTLVNILAGYLLAKTGQILINNIEVKKPGKNRIVVNQENDLFKWLTVGENMQLVSRDENNISQYLKLVGLNDAREYFPNHLSGGMKKRLSLARALAVNPDFLILDEPFDSLDHHLREELHLELDRIFSLTKKTTLLVTHDIDEAIFLSDRIIVLGGKPASILNQFPINFSHPRKLSLKSCRKFTQYRTILKKAL
ncbi:MAG: ABC transporter ATP-binding protein [Candidatus Beckwithbacteria bacterium]|nr:ABC transporter ATP-binding protein [Candidatus Beckwithbacteria bacterium]